MGLFLTRVMHLSTLEKSGGFSSYVYRVRWAWAFFRRELAGLAQDFWRDGGGHDADKRLQDDPLSVARAGKGSSANKIWHALPGEISEKMWGSGFVTPADDYITDLLVRPLNLADDMMVLDLAAGLGARMRRVAEEFGVSVAGREPDPELAARGRALLTQLDWNEQDSITPYDPMNLSEKNKYDCVIARETIYRVSDKKKFIDSVVACCKPKAQVSFTDYIVNSESKDAPSILAWRAFEGDAEPISLLEMAELWAKAGMSLRVHDDETEHYKKEVKQGLVRFARAIASGPKPDEETKKAIEKRIMMWAHRTAAMENGMRFYRFYGVR